MAPDHRTTCEWMGTDLDTLADLIPDPLRAICVGVNPAPPSVAVGHYYQGRQGQRFFGRLVRAGVLQTSDREWEDDAAIEMGIGFTDVVKRPTARASEVRPDELRYGKEALEQKLTSLGAPPLIFPFKTAAVALVGRFEGNGWLDVDFAGCRLFVMPGPYERREAAEAIIETLGQQLAP